VTKFPEIEIGDRKIGPLHPPLVIAEIGINHEGNEYVARQMIDAAAAAGCELVKFQCHVIDDEMSVGAKDIIPGNASDSIYEIMERCALSEGADYRLKAYVEQKGMIYISTPFSRAAAIRLEKMGVQAYKIGSGECNNYPLVEHIARYGKPVILSTGMNDLESIAKAVSLFHKHGTPYALLHCTSIYPTPYSKVRLGALDQLRKAFPSAVIGLSDHTINNYACLGAVALGASILERHFTDSMSRLGPDISVSMDGDALSDLISGANALFQMQGGRKEVLVEEQPTINFAYASVVTIAPIKAGEVFNENNIWVKRPGTGTILAEKFFDVIGRKSNKDLPVDYQLDWEVVDD